jgi:hypothetical protein
MVVVLAARRKADAEGGHRIAVEAGCNRLVVEGVDCNRLVVEEVDCNRLVVEEVDCNRLEEGTLCLLSVSFLIYNYS